MGLIWAFLKMVLNLSNVFWFLGVSAHCFCSMSDKDIHMEFLRLWPNDFFPFGFFTRKYSSIRSRGVAYAAKQEQLGRPIGGRSSIFEGSWKCQYMILQPWFPLNLNRDHVTQHRKAAQQSILNRLNVGMPEQARNIPEIFKFRAPYCDLPCLVFRDPMARC